MELNDEIAHFGDGSWLIHHQPTHSAQCASQQRLLSIPFLVFLGNSSGPLSLLTAACYFLQLSRHLQRAHKVQGDRCQKQQLSPKLALFTAGPIFRLVKVLSWANFQFCEGSTLGGSQPGMVIQQKGKKGTQQKKKKKPCRSWERKSWAMRCGSWECTFKGTDAARKKAFEDLIRHGFPSMWLTHEISADGSKLRISLKSPANKYAVIVWMNRHSKKQFKHLWNCQPTASCTEGIASPKAQPPSSQDQEATQSEGNELGDLAHYTSAVDKDSGSAHSQYHAPTSVVDPGQFPPTELLMLKALSSQDNSKAIETYEGLSEVAGAVWKKKDCLGSGAFGQVQHFVAKGSGVDVAVKRLHKKNCLEEYAFEVAMCQYVCGGPNLVHILDTFCACNHGFLVFELWGCSLHQFLRKHRCGTANTKELIQQVLAALGFLHERKVCHTDVKPGNILVKEVHSDSRTGKLAVQLADLGSAQLHAPAFGSLAHSAKAATTESINVTTLIYRAPEVLLGDLNYSWMIDIWSAGCVLYEVASGGMPYFQPSSTSESEVSVIYEIFSKRGTPHESKYWSALPHWPTAPASCLPRPLPDDVKEVLATGIDLLDNMLVYNPLRRVSARKAMEYPYITGENPYMDNAPHSPPIQTSSGPLAQLPAFGPQPVVASSSQPQALDTQPVLKLFPDAFGNTKFPGERGNWRLCTGMLGDDILKWLQDDPFFDTDVETLSDQELQAFSEPKCKANKQVQCRQKSCKIILSGGFGEPCSKYLHALRVDKPFPLSRVSRWQECFMEKNKKALQKLHESMCKALRLLSPKDCGKNGQHIIDTPMKNWCLTAGQLFITDAKGSLVEDDHCDGGAGSVHMALTLFGRRALNCWTKGGPKSGSEPAVVLEQVPGTVFFSCSAAFRHQVMHRPCDETELTSLGNLHGLSTSVMFRSTLFPYNRARLAQSTPSPLCVWNIVASSVEKWMSKTVLQLPCMADILGQEGLHEASSESCPSTIGYPPEDGPQRACMSQDTKCKGKKRAASKQVLKKTKKSAGDQH